MSNKSQNRNDYTMRPGKESVIESRRHQMAEAQHNSSNAFVRNEQNAQKAMGGKAPQTEDRYYKFDACMSNNGAHAQEFASKLTAGLDKKAFPVNPMVDRSQE